MKLMIYYSQLNHFKVYSKHYCFVVLAICYRRNKDKLTQFENIKSKQMMEELRKNLFRIIFIAHGFSKSMETEEYTMIRLKSNRVPVLSNV